MQTQKISCFYLILLIGLISFGSCRHHHKEYSEHHEHANGDDDEDHHHTGAMDSILEHMVLIQIKDSLNESILNALTADFLKLKDIKYVRNFRLGYPAATGDNRLYESYDISLSMYFHSLDELYQYQTDSTHLSLRNKNANLMAGPPVVIDQWILKAKNKKN